MFKQNTTFIFVTPKSSIVAVKWLLCIWISLILSLKFVSLHSSSILSCCKLVKHLSNCLHSCKTSGKCQCNNNDMLTQLHIDIYVWKYRKICIIPVAHYYNWCLLANELICLELGYKIYINCYNRMGWVPSRTPTRYFAHCVCDYRRPIKMCKCVYNT